MRRVDFVSAMRGYSWGGSEELWSQAALRLRGSGHRVRASVYHWPQRPEPLTRLASVGADLVYRPRRPTLVGRIVQKCLNRVFPSPLNVSERAWLKNEPADLVVISTGGPWDGIPWMLGCLEMDLPYCCIIQMNSESLWPIDEEIEMTRKAVRGARRVFFVSQANLNLMELQCGMRFDNAEVIRNPYKVNREVQFPWPREDGETHIACVARLDPRAKGQDILLEVLSHPRWRERPICVNLFGAGPCEQSLKSLASLLNVRRVRFKGNVSNIEQIWEENHALVLPSRFEGLPLAVVEAMLCSRPVIVTDVAGNAELVRDGENGFVAAAPTALLLADSMERAWLRRAEWCEMGRRARIDVLREIPSDPSGLFAQNLLSLVKGSLSG